MPTVTHSTDAVQWATSQLVTREHTTKPSAAGEIVPRNSAQHGRCADKWTYRKGSLKINDPKDSGQIVKKISQSDDVGISDDQQQQQQTKSTPSSTDTTSAVKPSVMSAKDHRVG